MAAETKLSLNLQNIHQSSLRFHPHEYDLYFLVLYFFTVKTGIFYFSPVFLVFDEEDQMCLKWIFTS